MVTVTRSNFITESNNLIRDLQNASFIAIDEEMTGISVPGNDQRPLKHQSPAEQYSMLRQAPERYSIIQLGVCLFLFNDEKSWTIQRYNFYLFPSSDIYASSSNHPRATPTREILLNPGAVSFLNQHNLDWRLWLHQGIPYLSRDEAKQVTLKYLADFKEQQKQIQKENQVNKLREKSITLTRVEDVRFFAHTMASIREWLDSSVSTPSSSGSFLMLPSCNSFLRRALYESIEIEYPSLICENAGQGQIKVWRLTDAQKFLRQRELVRDQWENYIVNQIGMTRVFHAISLACQGKTIPRNHVMFAESVDDVQVDFSGSFPVMIEEDSAERRSRPIPLVVHNGFMDLLFLMTHFHSRRLPDDITQVKEQLKTYFPVVYDTKVMASENLSHWIGSEPTHLGYLYQKAVCEQDAICYKLDEVNDGEDLSEQEHEAAYDAYMTGTIFLSLCLMLSGVDILSTSSNLHVDGLFSRISDVSTPDSRRVFGRNLIYQMSMFTLDLESLGSDPFSRGMLPDTSFRVSGIDPSTNTRDIVSCLSDLENSNGQKVEYEIIWIDDTTFIGAAAARSSSLGEDKSTLLRQNGPLIRNALKIRFPNCSITSMDKIVPVEDNKEKKSMLSYIGSFFGFGRKRAQAENSNSEGQRKRRRLNTT